MKATTHPFSLPLHQPLITAAGSVDRRTGLLLRVEDDAGHVGWGEAAPLPGFPGGTLPEVEDGLARWCAQPDRATLAELADLSVASAAVDTALVSLDAARAGLSLAAHLAGGNPPATVPVNALLGGHSADEVMIAARNALAEGFTTLKLKVGHRRLDDDISLVRALRSELGDDVTIRLDANRAWTVDEAHHGLASMRSLSLEYVEEPTRDLSAWPELATLGVPLAVDESMSDPGPDQAMGLMREGHVGALVTKIPLLFGVRPALAAAGVASARGVRVTTTSFIDTAVGVAAAVHLAAALGPGQPAAGLATGSMLAADVAAQPLVADGAIAVPCGPGLGVNPDLDALSP
ncbi:MAG: o-succinylbenzoate synthase [Acidimicrobiales bacterium]